MLAQLREGTGANRTQNECRVIESSIRSALTIIACRPPDMGG
eukprot:CAMPEP_0116958244 /NCGR_PEP_ID=MMETSP0467-20121206/44504_1 /TAXON_ID=283647 /ORGANISM="Mesodinium pulex, Strain SPMC105" /LENGTH=41 /DNA_ID= /DNA_START= /DNA_END= /DNA_ORIENTATION=